MLDQLLIRALAGSETLRGLVQGELKRLAEQGFLSSEDAEELRAEHAARLAEFAAEAGGQASKGLSGLGGAVRSAFDMPSRAEVLALTEELRQARARAEEAAGS